MLTSTFDQLESHQHVPYLDRSGILVVQLDVIALCAQQSAKLRIDILDIKVHPLDVEFRVFARYRVLRYLDAIGI